jgi:chemotaxis protein methyltransferase WspC
MKQIEQLLRERIGLDAASIGSTLIHRTVRLRMKSLGLKQIQDYIRFLAKSPSEWNDLVESVIVTETWFFRDQEPFAALVCLVLGEWLPAHPTDPARLLSLPCSSGEEPYSMVMALLDAGVPPQRFRVDAADISGRALARARLGVYGRNSFRGKNLEFRSRHFKPVSEGFALSPAIRRCVDFYQGNIFGERFLPGKANYDFIFCRNLLIYFDRSTQRRALENIARWLAPSGVLFVGPAEQPLVADQGFVPTRIPLAFACRKAGQACRLSAGPPALAPTKTPDVAGERSAPPPQQSHSAALERAQSLADAGRLKEAAAVCEDCLRESRGSAQAYYLLGLVREAEGDDRAIHCYRKALYLDPNHYEALLQMALLAERNGDPALVRTFKRRAERLRL